MLCSVFRFLYYMHGSLIQLGLRLLILLQENRFSKCDTCVKINDQLERGTKQRKPEVMKSKREHMAMVE